MSLRDIPDIRDIPDLTKKNRKELGSEASADSGPLDLPPTQEAPIKTEDTHVGFMFKTHLGAVISHSGNTSNPRREQSKRTDSPWEACDRLRRKALRSAR